MSYHARSSSEDDLMRSIKLNIDIITGSTRHGIAQMSLRVDACPCSLFG